MGRTKLGTNYYIDSIGENAWRYQRRNYISEDEFKLMPITMSVVLDNDTDEVVCDGACSIDISGARPLYQIKVYYMDLSFEEFKDVFEYSMTAGKDEELIFEYGG